MTSVELEQALHALAEGRAAEAEAMFQQIACAESGVVGGLAWAYLGRLRMLRFDVEGAREALERALHQASDHFVVRLERGAFFLRLGFYPEAMVELEAALRSAPEGVAREHIYRLLQRAWEQGKGSFVRRAVLPDLRRWLRSLRGSQGGKSACSSSSS
ncbi:tetratricopeptide repeat protein [Thermoflexus sp.]|uniref:tetratricopeptide repeat protein n=1 Tax=Thermoflexus sp. TaxID=1969742 RepID=UPI0035E40EAB